jgi:hypothetical protein
VFDNVNAEIESASANQNNEEAELLGAHQSAKA